MRWHIIITYALAIALVLFMQQQPSADEPKRTENKVLVLMCYKRIDNLQRTFKELSRLPGIKDYHLVVTQTVDPEEPKHFELIGDVLRTNVTFMQYTHIKSEMIKHDKSFSINQKKYGSKRNSIANMLNGVEYAFHRFPKTDFVMIMEDDVVLSTDILEYFERCKTLMLHDEGIKFATSYTIFRGTHPYFDHVKWAHHLPKYRPNPYSILTFEQKTSTFKTFFWMMRRSVLAKMQKDFHDMIQHNGETLHSLFKGCEYCENYCYDHWVEWVYRGKRILVPEVARAAQFSVGGMTTPEDKRGEKVLSNEYNQVFVGEKEFIERHPVSRLAVVVNVLGASVVVGK